MKENWFTAEEARKMIDVNNENSFNDSVDKIYELINKAISENKYHVNIIEHRYKDIVFHAGLSKFFRSKGFDSVIKFGYTLLNEPVRVLIISWSPKDGTHPDYTKVENIKILK